MAKLRLSFAVERSERTLPLIDGTIRPEGIELVPIVADPSEIFWRQLKFNEFDISALSFSSYMIAKSQGSKLIAIPVFPARRFMHTQLFIHTDSGVKATRRSDRQANRRRRISTDRRALDPQSLGARLRRVSVQG